MLHFQTPADSVMTALVASALEARADWLEYSYIEFLNGAMYDEWEDDCELLSRSLTLKQIIAQQRLLRTALLAPEVYRLTDMQFLVLYEALLNFTSLYNDGLHDSIECPELNLGPYKPEEFRFNDLIELFFWDIDFLLKIPSGCHLDSQVRNMCDLSDSAIRAAAGHTALPEDLQLEIDHTIVPLGSTESYYKPYLSDVYPCLSSDR